MKTLYWHETGQMLRVAGETLHIDDLNPETNLTWRLTRWEQFRIGLHLIWNAIF